MNWAETRRDFQAFIPKLKLVEDYKDERIYSLNYLLLSNQQIGKKVSPEKGCPNC